MKIKMKGIRACLGFLVLACVVCASSCQADDGQHKQKEIELKEKELELKEREINLKEKQAQQQPSKRSTTDQNPMPQKKASVSNKKELRYLYYANGGVVVYFDDGTIVGCPRCDFCRTTILAMFNDKPHSTYAVQGDGSLLINNSAREFPNHSKDPGWALIAYKWLEKVPQY
jgi:ferredoxin